MYADDLTLTSESREEVVDWFRRRKKAPKMRGLKMNLSKTVLLVTAEEAEIIKNGQVPCSVCGQGVGVMAVISDVISVVPVLGA